MMTEQVTVDVGRDFSPYPAGRLRSDGRYSGERFRQEYLVPHLKNGYVVKIEMDSAFGYGPSFIEEAFGGLVRVEGFEKDWLKKHLIIVTDLTNRSKMIFDDISSARPEPHSS